MLGSGASLFGNHCAACHGENAAGQANLFPDLTDRAWQWGGEPAQIELTITAGRQAVMPPWQAVLGDEGVAQVADYVLSLSRRDGGNTDAAPSAGQGPYSTYCSACHGPDGSGQPALGAPALDDDDWLYGGSAAEVRASIANGRNGVMPAFGGRLDTAQIKMLVAWLSRDRETSSELAARR